MEKPNHEKDGKVESAAPAPAGAEKAQQELAPRSQLEEILTRIQGYLLHLQEIGMDDNSFQLEGHSLTTAQLIAQLQELSLKPLLLQRLFKAPIIAQLTQEIAQVLDN